MSDKTESLPDGVLRELTRNREAWHIYRTTPNGEVAALLINNLIERAERALAYSDTVVLLQCYSELKDTEL